MRERYSKKEKRRRIPREERVVAAGPISRPRLWAAVGAGTFASVTSFGFVATAVVQAGDGNNRNAVLAAVAAALLVPALLLLVGLISRAGTPWRTATFASVIVLAGFLGGSVIAREPATGFTLGVGLGSAWALRAEPGLHLLKWRLWTAVGLTVYIKIVFLFSPALAIVAAPLVPVVGTAVIDMVTERRAAT